MRIRVRLWGALERYRPGGVPPGRAFEFDAAEPLTVDALARSLGIPEGLMRICSVGDALVDHDTELRDGDEVSLLPAASGGAGRLAECEGGLS